MKKPYTHFIIIGIISFLLPLYSTSQALFQTGQTLSTGIDAEVVCIGDVNHDGLEDIVSATGTWFSSQFDFQLSVYIQSIAGTFPVTVNYPYPHVYPGIKAIDIKDVNNDTFNDVIIGYGDSIGIFFQNSAGTLDSMISYYSGTGVDDIKVGDLNNDGLEDILVCHWNVNYIKVFYQSITGFTTSIYTKPIGGYDEIEIGDVNSDGLNDVVYMAGQGAGGIHLFTQNASGTLNNYISYFASGGPSQSLNGIVIGDINNDGANDVIATKGGNQPSAEVVFWYQDTVTKLLSPGVTTLAYEIPENIELADFNCDGNLEIVINHSGWNSITVWSPDLNGNYIDYDRYNVSVIQHPKPQGLATGDINHDGKLDIVCLGGSASVQLLYNISIPTTFIDIDTTIVNDTIVFNQSNYNYFIFEETIDSIIGAVVINTDSFLLNQSYHVDSIRIDSVFSRTGSLCSSAYNDIVSDSYFSIASFANLDTIFWSNTIDTIPFSNIPKLIFPEIIISPNPFVDQITFICNSNKSLQFTLFDGVGQIIIEEEFISTKIISTEDFAGGVYFYQFRDEYGLTKSGKIIKQ